jgi:hypothetical protein
MRAFKKLHIFLEVIAAPEDPCGCLEFRKYLWIKFYCPQKKEAKRRTS